jgi:hypothetical protein
MIEPDKEIITYKTPEKCIGKIQYFLFPIDVIPNGIDTSVFKPIPKNIARRHLIYLKIKN